jgi:hypothetical protein
MYLKLMTKQNLVLQWTATVLILLGHGFNGFASNPLWSLAAFAVGTVLWLVWSVKIRLHSQALLNVVAFFIITFGIINQVAK